MVHLIFSCILIPSPPLYAVCCPLTTPLDGACMFVCSEAPECGSGLPVRRRSVGAACFTLHGALHEAHSTLTLAGSHKLWK